MLANPEQYDDTNGCVTFRIKVSANGFGASALLKDGTWADFAASSSVSTFCRVMETICHAKSVAEPQTGFAPVGDVVFEQVRRETAEACAQIVCDADVLSNRDYEHSDDGRGSLDAAAKEIREKYGIAAAK